jgi:hypothetical protein
MLTETVFHHISSAQAHVGAFSAVRHEAASASSAIVESMSHLRQIVSYCDCLRL